MSSELFESNMGLYENARAGLPTDGDSPGTPLIGDHTMPGITVSENPHDDFGNEDTEDLEIEDSISATCGNSKPSRLISAEMLLNVPSSVPAGKIRTTTNVEITIRELYAFVYLMKMSDARIAAVYNLSTKTIRNFRRKSGLSSNFKAGSMDLPLKQVSTMIQEEGLTYEDVARELNSTKTAVKLFCARNNIQSIRESWPISRQELIHHTLLELYVSEIAYKYDVDHGKVLAVYEEYGITPFSGVKTHTVIVDEKRPETPDNPYEDMDTAEIAHCVFGKRFMEHRHFGFLLDSKPINAIELYMLIKCLLPPYRVL